MVRGAASGCSVQVLYVAAVQGRGAGPRCRAAVHGRGAGLRCRTTVHGRGSRRSRLPPEGSTHRAVRRERARAGRGSGATSGADRGAAAELGTRPS